MARRTSAALLLVFCCTAGCRSNVPPYELAKEKAEAEQGASHGDKKAEFPWGPAAPTPPLTPSPVPQMPEQPGSPMSPGDGPKMEDKNTPSTSNPSQPK